MKKQHFFLIVVPLVWLAVALISYQLPVDKIYVLAIAPSVWLAVFGDFFSHPIGQIQAAGLPAMCLIGLALLGLKMTPRVAIISSVVLATILWVVLLTLVSKGTGIHVPWAKFAWFLCCFNISLCLLPLVALLGSIGRRLVKALKSSRTQEISNTAEHGTGCARP